MNYIENNQVKPEAFEAPLLSIHLKVMRLFGFITGSNQRYPLLHFLRGAFITASFVAFVVLNLIRVFRGIHIIEADFGLRPVTVTEITYTIHVVNAFLQRERITRLANFIHEELLTIRFCSDDLEDEIIRKSVKYLRRVTYLFSIPAIVEGFMICLDCLIQSFLQLDVIYEIVLSPQKLNGTAKKIVLIENFPFGEVLNNFIIGYVGSFYALILTCIFIPFIHTFSTCLFMFAILKIEILSKHMRNMEMLKLYSKLKINIESDQLHENEKHEMRLKMCEYCALEQIKIRWFNDELQRFLRVPIFADFFIFSILLCVTLFMILIGSMSYLDYIYSIAFVIVMTGFQLLYHWQATLLTNSHEALGLAIYSCDWYNYPVKMQKHIQLNMMDSSRPFIIKAFFFQLRLETVIDILKGAFSYYSLLRNLGSDN